MKRQGKPKRNLAALLYSPVAASLVTVLTLGVAAAKAPHSAGD